MHKKFKFSSLERYVKHKHKKGMKKIFLIAIILLMVTNFVINVSTGIKKEQRTPMSEFKSKVEMAPMKEYRDPDFGYTVKYPCFFQQEDTSLSQYQGYARFSFTNQANIILESYITPNNSPTLLACADSLAQKLRCERTMKDSSFILSGPVYENGVRTDGYSHYDKFIKSGKMLFVYSLTYPDSYKPALPRLFRLIDDWKVLGAY